MANYHPDRFSSYTFLASGYWPSGPFDIDTLIAQEIRTMGWSKFGYQKFFNESDSGAIVDAHQDSFVDLIYPEDMMKTWKEAMGPVNLTRQWLMTDTRRARAKYISEVVRRIAAGNDRRREECSHDLATGIRHAQ